MSKLFRNKINLETGQIFSINGKREVGNYLDKGGYRVCNIKDIYGNTYWRSYQVILAEGLQLPKHLWPIDENGRRYEPDHINTNRTDDRFENLRLVPKIVNNNNEITRKKKSLAVRKHVYQYTMDWELIGEYDSIKEASEKLNLLDGRISDCCNGNRKSHGGFRWSFVKN